jgi:pimeloyl-ACP methyl ester carboxylesterase
MKRLRFLKGIVAFWLFVMGSLLSGAAGAVTPTLVGQWHGTLQTPAGAYLLELTVKDDGHGTPVATLESLDQAPGEATPISQVQLQGEQLKLEISAISAVYEGHFDAEHDRWVGSWRQGTSFPLTWVRGPVPPLPTIAGIDGTWRATLLRNGNSMRLIVHITTSSRGTRAKLDSPDMGAANLEVSELSRQGTHVHWRVPAGSITFEGELSDQAGKLGGTWQREGMPPATVQFVREAAAVSDLRPQTPVAPFPYRARAVTFTDTKDGTVLAGTLTLPEGPGPFPAAVLVSGSGPEDRDETFAGHKPFAVLADYLTRNGIAVLRYDDRGVAQSSGNFDSASLPEFTNDARAAIDFLAAQPEVDTRAIGLIGHSQGGIVGPLSALKNQKVAYLVLLGAPATGMADVLIAQMRMAAELQGQSKAILDTQEPAWRQLGAVAGKARDHREAQANLDALLTPAMMRTLGLTDTQRQAAIDRYANDWLRDLLHYDARSTLAALPIPLLALNGSLDRLVPADANLAAIRLATAGNPDVTVRQMAGLNHMFQPAHSGTMVEYGEIAVTFEPEALQTIGEWIKARFGAAKTTAEVRNAFTQVVKSRH